MTFLVIGSLMIIGPHQVHAGAYSANSVRNGGFESRLDARGLPPNWNNDTFDCRCTPGPTITVNDTEAILGHAARLDIGQADNGFMGIYQVYPNCNSPSNVAPCNPFTHVSNFTAGPDEFDFWFRLDPKYAGKGVFEIKFLGLLATGDTQELDYVIDPPTNILSWSNQTFTQPDPNAGTPSVKSILLGRLGNNTSTPLMAPPGTWVHFTRNVTADWMAQMTYFNNTNNNANCSPCMLPGFQIEDTFDRIEFVNLGYCDKVNGKCIDYHGMTAWIDNVNFYWSSNTPPPPPAPPQYLEFNFTDITGKTSVDNNIQWKIFNATGYIGTYTRGSQTLPLVNYWLEAYYPAYTGQAPEPYRIFRGLLPFDANITIQLPLLAEPMTPGAFVAFPPAVLNTTSIQQNTGALALDVKVEGDAHYVILAKVPTLPKVVLKTVVSQTELYEGSSWFYDPNLSIVQLPTSGSAKYTLYFEQPFRIPTISFTDRTGVNVNSLLEFNITNVHGQPIPLVPGQITPDQDYPYYLQAYYQGYRIYRSSVDFSRTAPIMLQMVPLTQGYLIVNSTIAGINITTQSSSTLTFDLSGTGPFLILVRVPAKPAFLEVNGEKTADWVYDGTNHAVVLETSTQGTISMIYTNPQPDFTAYYVVAGILGSLTAVGSGIFFNRKRKTGAQVVDDKSKQGQKTESSLRPRKQSNTRGRETRRG